MKDNKTTTKGQTKSSTTGSTKSSIHRYDKKERQHLRFIFIQFQEISEFLTLKKAGIRIRKAEFRPFCLLIEMKLSNFVGL